jgi:hypothetical protein
MSETRRIQTIFVNGRWDEREKIGFQHLQIRFRDLETWSGYDPFRWDSDDRFKERSLQIKPWKVLTLFQDDYVTVDLENGTSEFSSLGAKDMIKLERVTWISIKARNEQPYEFFHPYIGTIQSFLCFCLGIAVYPETITGYSSTHILPKNFTLNPLYFPITICTTAFRRYKADRLPENRWVRPPLPYEDLEGQTQKVIERWMALEKQFKIPWMLFLSTLFAPEMYLEQTFLTRAQCIEIYHRNSGNYTQTLHDPDVFAKRLKAAKQALIQSGLDTKVRHEFIRKIKNGNIPSFRDRIDQILKKHAPLSFSITRPLPAFAETVANNRNYLTHYGEKEFTPATPDELTKLTKNLGCLFYLCLLDELELDKELIEKVFNELEIGDLPM